jgi:sensor histidine kinase YesM
MGAQLFRKPKQRSALRLKLGLLFFASFVLPTILFGGFILVMVQRILENNVYSRQESAMEQFVEDFDRLLVDLDRVARTLSYDIPFSLSLGLGREDFTGEEAFRRHEASVLQRIHGAVEAEPRIGEFFLHTPNGELYSSLATSHEAVRISPIDPELYQVIASGEHRAYLFRCPGLPLFEGFADGCVAFATIMPVFDLEQKHVHDATLVFLVDRGELDELAATHRHSTDGLFLFDPRGVLIYSSNPEIAYKSLSDSLRQEVAAGTSGRIRTESPDARNALVNHMASRFGTVRLLGFTSSSRVDDNISTLTQYTLYFLLAIVILLFLSVIYFSREISYPIGHLEAAVQKLEDTQFQSAPISPPPNQGVLSDHFQHVFRLLNEMLSRLGEYHDRQKEQELEILQAQINPHFVYNTLNTIRVLAELKGEEELSEATRSLIRLLRSSIRIGQVFIPVDEEIAQIRDYVSLQSLRYDNSFDVNYDIDSEAVECGTIKFALQPIVENAIFHGVNGSPYRGLISISVKRNNGSVEYTVADNGKGVEPRVLEDVIAGFHGASDDGRIGLRNVNARLVQYFGPGSALSISGEPGIGTIVRYRIPATPFEEMTGS